MRSVVLLVALLVPFGPAAADHRLDVILSAPPPAPADTPGVVFFAAHEHRVRHAMLTLQPSSVDRLDDQRGVDRLRLLNTERGGDAATLSGLALFAGTTVTAAHAPRPLRVLFDARLHAGPALLAGGGMGIGIGGSL